MRLAAHSTGLVLGACAAGITYLIGTLVVRVTG